MGNIGLSEWKPNPVLIWTHLRYYHRFHRIREKKREQKEKRKERKEDVPKMLLSEMLKIQKVAATDL